MHINKINKNFHEKKNFINFLHPVEDYLLFFIKKKIKIFVNTNKNIIKPFIILFETRINITFEILLFSY